MSTVRYMSEAIIGMLRVAGFEPLLYDDESDAVMVEVPDHTWAGEEFNGRVNAGRGTKPIFRE